MGNCVNDIISDQLVGRTGREDWHWAHSQAYPQAHHCRPHGWHLPLITGPPFRIITERGAKGGKWGKVGLQWRETWTGEEELSTFILKWMFLYTWKRLISSIFDIYKISRVIFYKCINDFKKIIFKPPTSPLGDETLDIGDNLLIYIQLNPPSLMNVDPLQGN